MLLSRFVHLASLVHAQTAPITHCRLSKCSTDPAGAKKNNLLWSLKYYDIWCLIMKNEWIYLKNLPSAENNKNTNVFDNSASGRELYHCDWFCWVCLRQIGIWIQMCLLILPSAGNYMVVVDFVESAFGRQEYEYKCACWFCLRQGTISLCLILLSLPSADRNMNTNVLADSAFGRELYESCYICWACLWQW